MDIRELIRSTKGDRSYERLAVDAGGMPNRQRWQQLATEEPKAFPTPETIHGMAAALGVRPNVVVLSFAESFGITAKDEPRLVTLLPPGTERLAEEDVAQILRLVRRLIPAAGATVTRLSAGPGRTTQVDAREAASRKRGGGRDKGDDPNA